MATDDKAEDPIEAATPEVVDGIKVPTRSTADADIDTEARAERMKLDNLKDDGHHKPEETTPAKLREHYREEVRTGRIGRSITGLETRIRQDLGDDAGNDEKVRSLALSVLDR